MNRSGLETIREIYVEMRIAQKPKPGRRRRWWRRGETGFSERADIEFGSAPKRGPLRRRKPEEWQGRDGVPRVSRYEVKQYA
jgi:hypothetical protein